MDGTEGEDMIVKTIASEELINELSVRLRIDGANIYRRNKPALDDLAFTVGALNQDAYVTKEENGPCR